MADEQDKHFEARVRDLIDERLLRSIYRSEANPTQDLRLADIYKTREIIAEEIARVAARGDGEGDLRVPDVHKVRDIARELIREAIEPGKMGNHGDPKKGGTGVPDVNRVREIAQAEIAAWQKERPRWWNIRRRLETQIVSGGLAVIALLALFDVMVDKVTDAEQAVIRDGVHLLVGTDSYVDDNVRTRFQRWSDSPEEEPELKAALGAGLNNMAREDAPDFTEAIHRAIRAQPVLMFHAEAKIGASDDITVQNLGCYDLVWHWQETGSEILPDAFRLTAEELEAVRNRPEGSDGRFVQRSALEKNLQACRSKGTVELQSSLYLPFWARFHSEGNAKPDQVTVYLSVSRSLVPPAVQGDQVDEIEVVPHPYPNSLDYLTIEYRPMVEERLKDGGESVDLTSAMTSQMGGFFAADISALVRDRIRQPALRQKHSIFELMHNLEVSREELLQDPDCTYSNPAEFRQLHTACLSGEVVVVHAFIAVNKDVSQSQ